MSTTPATQSRPISPLSVQPGYYRFRWMSADLLVHYRDCLVNRSQDDGYLYMRFCDADRVPLRDSFPLAVRFMPIGCAFFVPGSPCE